MKLHNSQCLDLVLIDDVLALTRSGRMDLILLPLLFPSPVTKTEARNWTERHQYRRINHSDERIEWHLL